MAVDVRRGLEIPEPSDYSSCEDDDDVIYVTDLQQPDNNNLAESGRVINKLLNNLVDNAWELISEQEKIKSDEQAERQIPTLSASKEMKVCSTCTINGLVIFVCTCALYAFVQNVQFTYT